MEFEIILVIFCIVLIIYIMILVIVMTFWLRLNKSTFNESRGDRESGLVLFKEDSDSLTNQKSSSESLSGNNKDHKSHGIPATRQESLRPELDPERATIRSLSLEEEVEKNGSEYLLKYSDNKQKEKYSRPITLMNIEVKEELLVNTKPKPSKQLDQKEIDREQKAKKDIEPNKDWEPIKDSATIMPLMLNVREENILKDKEVDDEEYKLVHNLKSENK